MSDEIDRLKEEEKENFATLTAEKVPVNGSPAREPATVTRRRDKGGSGLAGVVLIVIGGIFLLTNLTGLTINNWWALFILIPAFSNFHQAWRSYQQHGRLTRGARGSITGGLILTLIASAFLFTFLSWDLIWPALLIILGISALLGGWFE